MDFTLRIYRKLLNSLKKQNYSFHTFQELNSSTTQLFNFPLIVLRHDVDRCPQNALKMAELEAEMGIKASYYFRIPKTFKPDIIKQIANLGHEIGYHYENLAVISKQYRVSRKRKGNPVKFTSYFTGQE